MTTAEQFRENFMRVVESEKLDLEELYHSAIPSPVLEDVLRARRIPSRHQIVVIARALKIDPDRLLEGIDPRHLGITP